MKLLHIDSSVLGANSVSRQLTAQIVDQWVATHPGTQVEHLDLATRAPSHLSADSLGFRLAPGTPGLTEVQQQENALSEALVTQFLAADVVVIGAPQKAGINTVSGNQQLTINSNDASVGKLGNHAYTLTNAFHNRSTDKRCRNRFSCNTRHFEVNLKRINLGAKSISTNIDMKSTERLLFGNSVHDVVSHHDESRTGTKNRKPTSDGVTKRLLHAKQAN